MTIIARAEPGCASRAVGDAASSALTTILVLQNTKHAMLPRSQTTVLWSAEIVSDRSRRSSCGPGGRATAAGASNSDGSARSPTTIYEPRRERSSTHGFAIGFGVFGGLWWALATWGVVFTRHAPRLPIARGLDSFEVAALCGALTGGLVGAVVGLAVGHRWETSHRRATAAEAVDAHA